LVDKNYAKGIGFGIISLFFVSMQPIIANSRSAEVDSFLYSAMTSILLFIFFFPLTFIERRRFKNELSNLDNDMDTQKIEELNTFLDGFKNHKFLLLYLGINFAFAYVLFFWGYELAGAINGSLAQKADLIFALLFGYLINKENISKTQIIFSILLFFGLIVAVTQGSFNLLELNLGVILMLITVMLWMSAHSITRPFLENKEISPFQLIFIRNAITGSILFSSYLIFNGIQAYALILDPINMINFLLIGIFYGVDLYCFYLSLSYIRITKVSILMAPSLIITSFFAMIFLSEVFTIFHLIGSSIVLISIVVIIKLKDKE